VKNHRWLILIFVLLLVGLWVDDVRSRLNSMDGAAECWAFPMAMYAGQAALLQELGQGDCAASSMVLPPAGPSTLSSAFSEWRDGYKR